MMAVQEKLCIFYLLLLKLSYSSKAIVSVCPGGQLNLTCNTMSDQTILRWNMTFPHRPGYELRDILAFSSVNSAQQLTIGQTIFQFLKISASPLISTMVIDNVSAVFNSTIVECIYGGGVMTSMIINVIGNDTTAPGPIMISAPEQFRNETITVFLKWTVEDDYDTIKLNVSPQVPTMYNRTRAQLILSYNTLYNVSVTATICGQKLSYSTTELFYAKCTPPLSEEHELSVTANYNYPAIEGTNVTFVCNDPSLAFNGSNSSTCMRNGKWDPDPVDIKCIPKVDCGVPSSTCSNCISVNYSSTLEASTMTFRCKEGFLTNNLFTATCLPDGSWVPNPISPNCNIAVPGIPTDKQSQDAVTTTVASSFIVFILSSTLFFFIGCTCGWFIHKHQNLIRRSDKNRSSQPAPLYEDLQPSTSMPKDQTKTFELKENIAYGPIQLM